MLLIPRPLRSQATLLAAQERRAPCAPGRILSGRSGDKRINIVSDEAKNDFEQQDLRFNQITSK